VRVFFFNVKVPSGVEVVPARPGPYPGALAVRLN